jgi:hypothetical protein
VSRGHLCTRVLGHMCDVRTRTLAQQAAQTLWGLIPSSRCGQGPLGMRSEKGKEEGQRALSRFCAHFGDRNSGHYGCLGEELFWFPCLAPEEPVEQADGYGGTGFAPMLPTVLP